MTEKTKYKFIFEVLSITERKEKFAYQKDGTFSERSLGWFVRFSNSSAIGPFDEQPDFKPGDKVTMSMS